MMLDEDDLAAKAAADASDALGKNKQGKAGKAGTKKAAKQPDLQLQGTEYEILDESTGDAAFDKLLQDLKPSLLGMIEKHNLSTDSATLLRCLAGKLVSRACKQDLLKRALDVRRHTGRLAKQVARKSPDYVTSPDKLDRYISRLGSSHSDIDETKKSLEAILVDAAEGLAQAPDDAARDTIYKVLERHHTGGKMSKAKRDPDRNLNGLLTGSVQKHLQAVHAALEDGDCELAAQLLVRYTSLDAEARKLMSVAGKIGAKEAQQLFIAQQDPYSGITPEMWQLLSTLVSNKEYKKVFETVALPAARPPKKRPANAAAEASVSDSGENNSSSSDESYDKPSKKAKKNKDHRGSKKESPAVCSLCGKTGHMGSDCWTFQNNLAKAIAKASSSNKGKQPQQQSNAK